MINRESLEPLVTEVEKDDEQQEEHDPQDVVNTINEKNLELLITQLEEYYKQHSFHLLSGNISIVINALDYQVPCSVDLFKRFCIIFREIRLKFNDSLNAINHKQRHFRDQWQLLHNRLIKAIEKHPDLAEPSKSKDVQDLAEASKSEDVQVILKDLTGIIGLTKLLHCQSQIASVELSDDDFKELINILQEAIRLPSLTDIDKKMILVEIIYQVASPYWWSIRAKLLQNGTFNKSLAAVNTVINCLIQYLIDHSNEEQRLGLDPKWHRRCWGVVFQHLEFLGTTPHDLELAYPLPEIVDSAQWIQSTKGPCDQAILLHSLAGWIAEDNNFLQSLLQLAVDLNAAWGQASEKLPLPSMIDDHRDILLLIRRKAFKKENNADALKEFSYERRKLLSKIFHISTNWLPSSMNTSQCIILGSNSYDMCFPYSDVEMGRLCTEKEPSTSVSSQIFSLYMVALKETKYTVCEGTIDGCRLDDSAPLKDWTDSPQELISNKLPLAVSVNSNNLNDRLTCFLARLDRLEQLTFQSGYSLLFAKPLDPDVQLDEESLYQVISNAANAFLSKKMSREDVRDLYSFINPLPLLREWNNLKAELNSELQVKIHGRLSEMIGYSFKDLNDIAIKYLDESIDHIIETSPSYHDAIILIKYKRDNLVWHQLVNGTKEIRREILKESFYHLDPILDRIATNKIPKSSRLSSLSMIYRQAIALFNLLQVLRKSQDGQDSGSCGLELSKLVSSASERGSFNFKDTFYKPLNYFALSLKIFHSLETIQPLDIIEEAQEKGILGDSFACWVKAAFQLVIKHRIELHLKYSSQEEPLNDVLTTDKASLQLIYDGLIYPLRLWVKEFLLSSVIDENQILTFTSPEYMKPYFKALQLYLKNINDENVVNHSLYSFVEDYPIFEGKTPKNVHDEKNFKALLKEFTIVKGDDNKHLTEDKYACEFKSSQYSENNYLPTMAVQALFKEGEIRSSFAFEEITGDAFLVGKENSQFIFTIFNDSVLAANSLYLLHIAQLLGLEIARPAVLSQLTIYKEAKHKVCWALIQDNKIPQLATKNDEFYNYAEFFIFLLLIGAKHKILYRILKSDDDIPSQYLFPGKRGRNGSFKSESEISDADIFGSTMILESLPKKLIEKILLLDPSELLAVFEKDKTECNKHITTILNLQKETPCVNLDINSIVIELIKLQTLIKYFDPNNSKPIYIYDILLGMQPKIATIFAPIVYDYNNTGIHSSQNASMLGSNYEMSYIYQQCDINNIQEIRDSVQPDNIATHVGGSYLRCIKFTNMSQQRQSFYLSILKKIDGENIFTLDLSDCLLLTDNDLSVILSRFPDILTLKINNCPRLTVASFTTIGEQKNIIYLHWNGNQTIKELNSKEKNHLFPSLQFISLQGWRSLTLLDLSNANKLYGEIRLKDSYSKVKVEKAEDYLKFLYEGASKTFDSVSWKDTGELILQMKAMWHGLPADRPIVEQIKKLDKKFLKKEKEQSSFSKGKNSPPLVKNAFLDKPDVNVEQFTVDKMVNEKPWIGSSLLTSLYKIAANDACNVQVYPLLDVENQGPLNLFFAEIFSSVNFEQLIPGYSFWLLVQVTGEHWLGVLIKRLHFQSKPILSALIDPVQGDTLLPIINEAFSFYFENQQEMVSYNNKTDMQSLSLQNLREEAFSTGYSCLNFNHWYHPDFCLRLLYSQNIYPYAKVLFNDDASNTETFITQLNAFMKITTELSLPGIIICKKPGANNHFICCVLIKEILLIIDPLGKNLEREKDETVYQQILSAIVTSNENDIKTIYCSTNPIQKHDFEETNLVSCGPLVIEIALHLLNSDHDLMLSFFNNIERPQILLQGHNTIEELDIAPLLPQTILDIQNTTDEKNYHQQLIYLRRNHYDLLEAILREKPIEDFFCQELFNLLMDEQTTNEQISDMYKYVRGQLNANIMIPICKVLTVIPEASKINSQVWLFNAFFAHCQTGIWQSKENVLTAQCSVLMASQLQDADHTVGELNNRESMVLLHYAKKAIFSGDCEAMNILVPALDLSPKLLPKLIYECKLEDDIIDTFLEEQREHLQKYYEPLLHTDTYNKARLIVELQVEIEAARKKAEKSLKSIVLDSRNNQTFIGAYQKWKDYNLGLVRKEQGGAKLRKNALEQKSESVVNKYTLIVTTDSTTEELTTKLNKHIEDYKQLNQKYHACGSPLFKNIVGEVLASVWIKEKYQYEYKEFISRRANPIDKTLKKLLLEVANVNTPLSIDSRDEEGVPLIISALILTKRRDLLERLETQSQYIWEIVDEIVKKGMWDWIHVIFEDDYELAKQRTTLYEKTINIKTQERQWRKLKLEHYPNKLSDVEEEEFKKIFSLEKIEDMIKQHDEYLYEKWMKEKTLQVYKKEKRMFKDPDIIQKQLDDNHRSLILRVSNWCLNKFEKRDYCYAHGKIVYRFQNPSYWSELRNELMDALPGKLNTYQLKRKIVLVFFTEKNKMETRLKFIKPVMNGLKEIISDFKKKLNKVEKEYWTVRESKKKTLAHNLIESGQMPLSCMLPIKKEYLIEAMSNMHLSLYRRNNQGKQLSEMVVDYGVHIGKENTVLHGLFIDEKMDVLYLLLKNSCWHHIKNKAGATFYEVRNHAGYTILHCLFLDKQWDILYKLLPLVSEDALWKKANDIAPFMLIQDEQGNTPFHKILYHCGGLWNTASHPVHKLMDFMITMGAPAIKKNQARISVWMILQDICKKEGAFRISGNIEAFRAKCTDWMYNIRQKTIYEKEVQEHYENNGHPLSIFEQEVALELQKLRILINYSSQTDKQCFELDDTDDISWAGKFKKILNGNKYSEHEKYKIANEYITVLEISFMDAFNHRNDLLLQAVINHYKTKYLPRKLGQIGLVGRLSNNLESISEDSERSPEKMHLMRDASSARVQDDEELVNSTGLPTYKEREQEMKKREQEVEKREREIEKREQEVKRETARLKEKKLQKSNKKQERNEDGPQSSAEDESSGLLDRLHHDSTDKFEDSAKYRSSKRI